MEVTRKISNFLKKIVEEHFEITKYIANQNLNYLWYIHKEGIKKNQKDNNDIFLRPIDISDNTIPNGNAIMLINLIKLGLNEETKRLANSLNGYLNIYKNHMMTAIMALDFFNSTKSGKNCNERGCETND